MENERKEMEGETGTPTLQRNGDFAHEMPISIPVCDVCTPPSEAQNTPRLVAGGDTDRTHCDYQRRAARLSRPELFKHRVQKVYCTRGTVIHLSTHRLGIEE